MFAGAVCQQMAADSPRAYLIKMTKKLRDGPHLSRLPAQ